MPFRNFITTLVLIVTMGACSPQPETFTPQISLATPSIAVPIPATPESTSTSIPPSPTPFICNDNWQNFPIIPEVDDAMRDLYQIGVAQGNDPHAFSKIGDGEISSAWFFTAFDLGEDYYDLGDHDDLTAVIENFRGSFGRMGAAARRGFNTNLILDSSAGDQTICSSGESPLECELRLHNPSIVMLSLGTNQVYRPVEFEAGMRQIIDVLLARHILPILSTKGDNLEGDHRLNHTIACLAQEYQIPLWNFWRAIQPLPNHGLQSDLEHLTYFGLNDFSNSTAMQYAWTVRNLTGLQALNEVWRKVVESK